MRDHPQFAANPDARLDLAAGPFRSFTRRLAQDETLFCEGTPAAYVFVVQSGLIRCLRMTGDGRRHISRFAGPGCPLGLGAEGRWRTSAEAVGEAQVLGACAPAVEAAAMADPFFARRLWRALTWELEQREQCQFRLCRLGADERVADFLAALAAGGGDGWIPIPMSRLDIADHLGMTLETVSRVLHRLARAGTIRLNGAHRFCIRSPGALARLARGDRDGVCGHAA